MLKMKPEINIEKDYKILQYIYLEFKFFRNNKPKIILKH